jgi:hypothetical protein
MDALGGLSSVPPPPLYKAGNGLAKKTTKHIDPLYRFLQ